MRHLKKGLTLYNEEKATPGYTLFWPLGSRTAHIINMRGEVVHEWNLPMMAGSILVHLEYMVKKTGSFGLPTPGAWAWRAR